MLTPESLIAAGFKEFPPNKMFAYPPDKLFQKKFSSANGVRYFLDCDYYEDRNVWEARVCFNEGCDWYPAKSSTRILLYGDMDQWTPELLIEWSEHLWHTLRPRYYESFKESEPC